MTETKQNDTEMKVIQTKDGEVHITQPKNKRHRRVTVLLDSDDVLKHQVGGLKTFVQEYAVVGLAVGFIIGLQAQTLMKQLLDSFITPLLNMWLGNDLINRSFTVGSGSDAVHFAWGKFIYAAVSFAVVLVFVYITVKLLRLDKFGKKKSKK